MEGTQYMKFQESFEKMFVQINVTNFLFSPFSLSSSQSIQSHRLSFCPQEQRSCQAQMEEPTLAQNGAKHSPSSVQIWPACFLSFFSVQAQMQLGNLWFLLSLASLTAWEKEVRRMQGATGLIVIGSRTQNVCSVEEGVPGTEVSFHSTNWGISALAGTVLIVNQSVAASPVSTSTSLLLLPFLEW